MRASRAGFTLIELLVVIGIIALLAAFFLPDILGAQRRANMAADQANMRWQYQAILNYRSRYKKFPRGSGSKFVLDPWVRKVVDRTEQNFSHYWTPGLSDNDPQYEQLAAEDPRTIWTSPDDITSEDTHYAGPSSEARQQRKRLDNAHQPLMSNDNEFGPAFQDGTVHVLMGDGSVKTLLVDPDFLELGFDDSDPETFVEVGPESIHPLLKQLEK